MKTPISKSISIVSILLIVFTGAMGHNTIIDTAKNELAPLGNIKNLSANSNKANVVYPAILTGHESQSLSYIERFSINRREYLIRTFNKGKKFFPKIAVIFRKYDLPEEFKILMALESGFNPNAVSPAGAVGYWQIMAPVAREYGLRISERNNTSKAKRNSRKGIKKTIIIDERKNFNKSTCVAARYLKDRGRNLNNDCLLIVASYNWGVGNVWNAMERTGKSRPTFWDIKKYLPAETRTYVMNFIAINVILHNYEKFAKNKLTFQSEDDSSEDQEECSAFIGPVMDIKTTF